VAGPEGQQAGHLEHRQPGVRGAVRSGGLVFAAVQRRSWAAHSPWTGNKTTIKSSVPGWCLDPGWCYGSTIFDCQPLSLINQWLRSTITRAPTLPQDNPLQPSADDQMLPILVRARVCPPVLALVEGAQGPLLPCMPLSLGMPCPARACCAPWVVGGGWWVVRCPAQRASAMPTHPSLPSQR